MKQAQRDFNKVFLKDQWEKHLIKLENEYFHQVILRDTDDERFDKEELRILAFQIKQAKKAKDFLLKVKNPSQSQINKCRKVLSQAETDAERDARIAAIPVKHYRGMENPKTTAKNPTIAKHFKTSAEAERFRDQLYKKYDVVVLESSPDYAESGVYVFYVDGLIREREMRQKIKRNSFATPNNKIIRFDFSNWLDAGTATYYDSKSDRDITFDFIINEGRIQTNVNLPARVKAQILAKAKKQKADKTHSTNFKNPKTVNALKSVNPTSYILSVKDRPHVVRHFESKAQALASVRYLQEEFPSEIINLVRQTYSKHSGFGRFFIKSFKPKKPNFTNADFRKAIKETITQNSQMFQGKTTGAKVGVTAPNGTPSNLSRIGELKQIIYKMPNGGKRAIKFNDNAFLAMDIRRNLHCLGAGSKIKRIKVTGNGLADNPKTINSSKVTGAGNPSITNIPATKERITKYEKQYEYFLEKAPFPKTERRKDIVKQRTYFKRLLNKEEKIFIETQKLQKQYKSINYQGEINRARNEIEHYKSEIKALDNILVRFDAKPNFTNADFRKAIKETITQNSQMFQGKTTGAKVGVTAPNGTPSNLSRIGELKQIIYKMPNGGKRAIKFNDNAFLAMDIRRNLHCLGAGSKIKGIKVTGNGLAELGDLIQIDYKTDKAHINNGIETYYFHKLGEVTKKYPKLYADKECFPRIVNGEYDVWDVGIVN